MPVITTGLLETLKIIVPTVFALAIIGLTESLMTLSLIDEKTNTRGK
jgi:SulP family sulfate permease